MRRVGQTLKRRHTRWIRVEAASGRLGNGRDRKDGSGRRIVLALGEVVWGMVWGGARGGQVGWRFADLRPHEAACEEDTVHARNRREGSIRFSKHNGCL